MGAINNTNNYFIKSNPELKDYLLGTDEKTGETINIPVSGIGDSLDIRYNHEDVDKISMEFTWSKTGTGDKTVREVYSNYAGCNYKKLGIFIKNGYDVIKNAPDNLSFYFIIERYRRTSKKGNDLKYPYRRKAGYRYSPNGYGSDIKAKSLILIDNRSMIVDFKPDGLFKGGTSFPSPSGNKGGLLKKTKNEQGVVTSLTGMAYLQFRIVVVDNSKIINNDIHTGMIYTSSPLKRLLVTGFMNMVNSVRSINYINI